MHYSYTYMCVHIHIRCNVCTQFKCDCTIHVNGCTTLTSLMYNYYYTLEQVKVCIKLSFA